MMGFISGQSGGFSSALVKDCRDSFQSRRQKIVAWSRPSSLERNRDSWNSCRDSKIAEFPDAVTSRGTKHLKNLVNSIKKGYIPYVLFLTQIQGINNFKIAKDIDEEYYRNYLIAKKAGVNFIAYRCKLSSKEIKIEKKIKIIDG